MTNNSTNKSLISSINKILNNKTKSSDNTTSVYLTNHLKINSFIYSINNTKKNLSANSNEHSNNKLSITHINTCDKKQTTYPR